MISVDELLYEFELRINGLGREDNQNISLESRLLYLNNAQITWIKSKLNANNIYKIGYEGFRKRIDDLQVLKVNNHKLRINKGDNPKYLNYEGFISDVEDYMFYLGSFALASYKKCKDSLSVNLVKEGELETLYYNDNYNPSFKWRETLGTIGADKLYVYTDGSFTVDDIRLTYLRKPKKIDSAGSIHLDGTLSTDQDSELPEYAKNDIIDIAVGYAAQATDNQLQAQLAKLRERENE